MKAKKVPVIVISISLLSYVLFFQNCSSNTSFNSVGETQEVVKESSPIDPEIVIINPQLDLKLIHTSGSREFLVTAKGLSVTDSQCKLQFKKNAMTWTDFGNDFLCNSDIANVKFILPGDDWTNNFNATGGVQIRIVKSTTKAEVGIFSEKLICNIKPAATTETPLVDENCNGKWDDFVNGAESSCDVSSGALTFGSSYTCAAMTTCNGKVATFKAHRWVYSSALYSAPDCNYSSYIPNASGLYHVDSNSQTSGTTPTHPFQSTHPSFCESHSGYLNGNINNPVSGYSHYIGQWITANCNYFYYPSKTYL